MGRIAAIVIRAWRQSLALWGNAGRQGQQGRASRRASGAPRVPHRNDIVTVLGAPRRVISPGQAAGFAARSRAWRCIGCGKVHSFSGPVRVVMASPCSCGRIEFEPRSPRIRAPYSFRAPA